ncbi:MAG: hypothetical protein NTW87_21080, partial [Planctomycetota bacterium]|nr:hypothetical protein [Planctomycetota bacterium]
VQSPASGLQPDVWARAVAAVASQKGGALLASALSHAQSVRFDAAANVLSLGFSSSQLFYRDALEKPQNQAVLVSALNEVLGHGVSVAVERVEAAAPRANLQPPPALRTAAPPPPRPPPAAPVDSIEEAPPEETEIEFDGAGELPLRAPPLAAPAGSAPAAGAETAEDGPPRAPAAPLPKSGPAIVRDPAQIKALEEHPLVKMVVQAVDGVVVRVNRE